MLNQILHGDCRDKLDELPDDSVDLVVTSPPYNVGIEYGEYDDDIEMEEYEELLQQVFKKLDSVVKNTGRVCINVSLKNENGIIDIPSIVKRCAYESDWDLRFEIIWNKGSSESSSAWGSWRSPSSPRPIFNHEYIFVFDVGKKKDRSEKTIEKSDFMQYIKSVWNINPVTESDHPAPFPEEVPHRLIQLNSYRSDVILDPFMGSGTTAVVSEKLGRDWIGIEMNDEYINMAQKNIESKTGRVVQEDATSVFEY